MRTAFVTGGSGFIGGALVRRLVGEGWTVRALARSDASARAVEQAGARPVRGELADPASMTAGAEGAEVCFHAAAHLGDWGRREDFVAGNVQGTRNVIAAARRAGVRRLVHVGTEAAVLAGEPMVMIDERQRLRPDSPALYSATKAQAEEDVLAAARDGLETVVIRPRFVWGRGDTTLLPALSDMVRSGRFAWIGGGRHRTSTTHVDNAVEGLLLGAERGVSGAAYFVTDGTPVVFRDFVSRLLATQGLDPPSRSIPRPVAHALAVAGETAWGALPLPGRPPLTRFAYWVSALETTIDISRARAELGYAPVTTIEDGLAEMRLQP
ncbi:MAG: NAD-dependent epimerase/dehydratase family protein [Solirubrobacteraceae bacterium]